MSALLRAAASLLLSPIVLVVAFALWLRGLLRPPTAAGSTILLSISEVPWDEVWQRPQEFASRASRKNTVIYCAPVQLHRWLFTLRGRWRVLRTGSAGDDHNLTVLSPLIFSGHYRSRAIHGLNSWLVSLAVRPWLRLAMRVDVVVNSPYWRETLTRLFFAHGRREAVLHRLAYDLIDDFTAFLWSPAWSKDMHAALIETSDTVFTGTGELVEHVKETRADAEFIPCGVDFELFSQPDARTPDDIATLQHPIIGYFGSISDRLDLGLIKDLAAACPDASVVLIGPSHVPPQSLPHGANIHYLGLKPHDELPAYAHAFAVALIPFKLNAATAMLNPVKTLEYLAAGIPVVSTAIPDVRRYFDDAVAIADSPEQFVSLVKAEITSPDERRRAAGLEMARVASWDSMTERMLARLLFSAPVPVSRELGRTATHAHSD